ncbi:hypothetical protein CL614_09555 [archaeon]|nr:hypothetical protein [archaeon]
MNEDRLDKLMEKYEKSKSCVEDFTDLLDSLSGTDEKRKLLWKEIYHNAILDRENASMLFTDAFKQMQTGTTEHTMLGPILTKYLERMCKSNEQILKLAELIAKCEAQANSIDSDDVFSKIDE